MSPRLSACSMTIAVSLSLFVLPAAVVAQDSPPAYLQIFREVVKPGRNGPHVPSGGSVVPGFREGQGAGLCPRYDDHVWAT
jgi:hypothetical protein